MAPRTESPVLSFAEEKARLIHEQSMQEVKGPKSKHTSQDDEATQKRAKSLEPAAVDARKHMKRKAAEFDEADEDGDREVDFDEFVMHVSSQHS